MDVDLRQLEYFQAACRLGTITRAAEELHVSQPSVTSGIRRLESELETRLLDRGRRRVTATEDGRLFLRRVDSILTLVRDSAAELRDRRASRRETLRLGITPMMGTIVVPSAIARFRKAYPLVDLSIVEEGSLAIAARLSRGELDVGVMVVSDLPAGLASATIGSGKLHACLPPRHPLARNETISFDMLRDQPMILFHEDTYSRQLVMQECARHRFEPKVVFSSSQIGTVIGLVRQGVGIAFFVEEIAVAQKRIAVRPLAEPLELRTGIAWNDGRYLPRAAREFIEGFSVPR